MRTLPRLVLGLALVTLGTLTVTDSAWAKKGASTTEKKWTAIVVTEIPEFDAVFAKVKAIDDSVDAQTATLNTARTNVNTTLAVAEGSALSEAIKGAVAAAGGKLTFDASTIHLKAAGDAPDSTKTTADALNGLVDAGTGTVTTCTELAAQAIALVDEVKEFPAKIKSIVTDPAALLKATPLLAKDMKATAETPARVQALLEAANAIFTDMKAAFAS